MYSISRQLPTLLSLFCGALILMLCCVSPALSQPTVVDVTPATNANDVARDSQVRIDLNATLQGSSIDDQSIRIFGSQSGFRSTKGTIDVVAGTDARFTPGDLDYYPGERVFVTVTNASDNSANVMERPWTFSFDVAGEPAQAKFPSRSDYNAVLSNSQWGAVGDLDGDGDLDICQVHQDDDQFAVMLNNGSAAFSLDAAYGVGSLPGALALGDFDADGDLDVVVANVIENDISVLFNAGDATFNGRSDYATGSVPQKAEVADVNGDGHLDIITANLNSDNVSVFINNGSGVFAAAVNYASGDGCIAVRAGDVNNDGFPDLVTVNEGENSLGVLLNAGDGTFGAVTTTATSTPQELYLGDLDDDGDLDVAVAFLDDDEIGILTNNGSGTFAAPVDIAVGSRPKSLTMCDLDGDGDLDIAVSNRNLPFSISVLINDGGASFTKDADHSALGPECVMHGDFDGDGDIDLATANETALGNQLSIFTNTDVPAKLDVASVTPAAPNSGQSFAVVVNSVRNNGTLSNVTTNTQITAAFSDADLSLSGGSLTGTITGNAQTLNIAITNATLTPVAVALSVTATSGMSLTSTTTTISIGANQAPSISTGQTAVATQEDVARLLSVALADAESPVAALHVTATSDNQALIPDANITQQGATSATTVFSIQPVTNANGSADITLKVNDGLQTSSVTFAVTVNPVNDPPVISTTELSVCFDEDGSTIVTVSIGDIETATTALQVSGTSANQTLIADAGIVQQGPTGATVTMQINSVPNQNGTTTVTLSVFDGGLTRSTTISVTVKAVNDPPSISTSQTGICFDEDGSTTLTVNISDIESITSALTLTAMSGNQSLISDAALVQQGGTSATSFLLVTSQADANGTTPVTVSVSDGEFTRSTVFNVTVKPVNDPPTISTMADLNLLFNASTTNGFVINDIDNPTAALQVTATSSNQGLFADGGIVFSATAANMTLDVAPECDQFGAALITVTVSDGVLTSTAVFSAQVQSATTAVVITGASLACPASLVSYSVPADAAAESHSWAAVGGEIISGQGSAEVVVVWASEVADRLTVVRHFPNGCTSADVLLLSAQSLSTQLDFALLDATSTSISVLTNDSAGLTLIAVEDPTNGTASVSGANVIYSADAGFSGIEQFAYTVQNAAGCTAQGVVVVNVPANFTQPINLEFVERQKDRVAGVRGLRKTVASAISPDGKYVYAAGRSDHSIAIFSRDQNDGTLSYVTRVRNGHNGVVGLKYVSDVLVSSDNKYVYAVGYGDNSVVVLERNIANGLLTFVERKKNGQFEGTKKILGIARPRSLKIGIDGRSVYVTGSANNAVALFQRSTFSGKLTYITCYKDGSGGIDGLRGALGLVTSSDGRNVYATGSKEDKLAVFSRDLVSGALTFVERLRDGVGGVDGLDIAAGVTISPDGKHVYVAGKGDDALAAFARDVATGSLSFVDFYKNGQNGVSGLDGICGVFVSPDGRHVWAANTVDNSLVVFKRNSSSGELEFLGGLTDGLGGADGLRGATHVMTDNTSSDIYVSGSGDNALAQVFRNVAPQAVDDAVGPALANSTLTLSSLTNDSDLEGHTLQVIAKTNGALGTVSITGGGTSLQYAAGAVTGLDQFTYTIEDGRGGSSTATVTLMVAQPKSGVKRELQSQAAVLTISPNPAVERTDLVFSLEQTADVVLELRDLRGVRLLTQELSQLGAGQHRQSLELRDAGGVKLPAGVYVVQLEIQTADGLTRSVSELLHVR